MKRRKKGYAALREDGSLIGTRGKEWMAHSQIGEAVHKVVECYITWDDGQRKPAKKRK